MTIVLTVAHDRLQSVNTVSTVNYCHQLSTTVNNCQLSQLLSTMSSTAMYCLLCQVLSCTVNYVKYCQLCQVLSSMSCTVNYCQLCQVLPCTINYVKLFTIIFLVYNRLMNYCYNASIIHKQYLQMLSNCRENETIVRDSLHRFVYKQK